MRFDFAAVGKATTLEPRQLAISISTGRREAGAGPNGAAHAHPGPVANLIDLVEGVDEIEARRQRRPHCRCGTRGSRRDSPACSRADAHRSGWNPRRQSWSARRPEPNSRSALKRVSRHRYDAPPEAGDALLVIQVDVVRCDVVEFGLREIELRRVDVLALGALIGEIQIRRERVGGVIAGEFGAVLLAVA